MPWAAITAIGTVLAGLALPLAFIQLGALRQDRLREQISKVGAWTQVAVESDPEERLWQITLFIRNASELPVKIGLVRLEIQSRGKMSSADFEEYLRRGAAKERQTDELIILPGIIAPGDTWQTSRPYISRYPRQDPSTTSLPVDPEFSAP